MHYQNCQRTLAGLLLPFLTLGTPHAVAAQSGADGDSADRGRQIMVGGGVLMSESPFRGEGTLANPIPLIALEVGPAYVDGLEAGLTVQPFDGPIAPFASVFVAGRMTAAEDRQDFTADAGIRLGLTGEAGELSAEYRRDITGEFKGGEFQLRYAYPIRMGDFTLTPSAQVNWLDKRTANHMYGVTAAQRARAIARKRKVILPVAPITDKATNLGGALTATYSVGGGVTLIGVLSGTYLDKSIHRSPAIDQKWESTAILGLAYSF